MCDIPSGVVAELSTEQWKDVIKDASRLGAQTIVFSGGEPLLREDIYELIAFARKNNLSACVTSNGYLIDERTALKLSEVKVNVVNVSVEGARQTHDFLRGAGSFDKAISALNNLKKYKIESTVAATVSKYNYKDMLYILEIARGCGATTVRLQPFNSIFLKGNDRNGEFLIDKSDIPKLAELIKEFINLAREYGISVNPVEYLLKIPEYLSGKKFYPLTCGALWYSCPINPNGDLLPCWIEGADNKLIGNVKTERLYSLWLSKKRAKMINAIIKNGCKGCLMSCYDEAFTRKLLKESIAGNVRKIKKITDYQKVMNKILQLLRSQIIKLKLKYRFYSSYRGSFFGVLKRRLRGFLSRTRPLKQNKQGEKDFVFDQIEQAKKKLKKEINGL
jgi:radical SAM protein with 4Fe4S-binding SPASM domain